MKMMIEEAKEVYYFGCWSTSGHFLHDSTGRTVYRANELLPESVYPKIDTGFCPQIKEQTQGRYCYVKVADWTIISFWDRTVDTRLGSNSNFLIKGEVSKDELWKLARKQYPRIFERFNFEFKEIKDVQNDD